MVGGQRCTSEEALARFFNRTTAAADGQPELAEPIAANPKAIHAAEEYLSAEGFETV
jgi:hypothetical protein